jgi:ferredoxin-type protein NapH
MDLQGQNGLLSTYRESYRARGPLAFVIAATLVGFYTVLYWEEKLSGALGGHPLTDLAEALHLRNRWYLYGFLYCVAMTAGGVYYLRRHGNSRYNRARIAVNVGVQVVLGFTLPFVMPLFGQPEFYFSYFWPLKYDYLYPQTLVQLPVYLSVYAVLGGLVAAPVLAFFFGKRWYCSWVCGCGGLANTFGDPYRHLTSKSSAAWRFERWSIHSVLVLVIVTTALVAADFFWGASHPGLHRVVSGGPVSVKELYGFVVGSILAGVIGTGLYPLLGPRSWCRNFCPMAALLGLIQKLGRYRITVKPDMCISCGNCSTYCEMGIDVRAYAQRNESFTRASCVGCGMCAHMCPRGVLKLENTTAPRRVTKRGSLPIVSG